MPHDVIMPALGVAQDTGLIVTWLKNSGDAIKTGDALMEIETDKAVVEVEAQADGYLSSVSAAEGEQVPVGQVVALIVESAPLADNQVASPIEPSVSTTSKSDADKPVSGSGIDTSVPAASTATSDQSAVIAHSVDTQKLSNVDEQNVSASRILASPKARRLALEQGLELDQLAEYGVSQPYHVADLNTLKYLDKEKPLLNGTIPTSKLATASLLRIDARVLTSAQSDFTHWLATQRDLIIPLRMVWLRYATAALRRATGQTEDTLIVELRQLRSSNQRYVNADHSRLSRSITECADHHSPALVLYDLNDSPIVSLTTSEQSAPVLTIRQDGKNYAISLEYRNTQLNESAAIVFITDFAERVAEPLRHLL